jgi:hypothetical protein
MIKEKGKKEIKQYQQAEHKTTGYMSLGAWVNHNKRLLPSTSESSTVKFYFL